MVKSHLKTKNEMVDSQHKKNDVTVETIQNLVRSDYRLRIRDMANTIGVTFSSLQSILNDDLGIRRVYVKFIQRIMTEDQMDDRKLIVEIFKQLTNENDFFQKLLMNLVFIYDNCGTQQRRRGQKYHLFSN